MIELSKCEKDFIKFTKFWYDYKDSPYPFVGEWGESFKPLFKAHYGWGIDECNSESEYLNCLFNKLLDIWLKIEEPLSNNNHLLKDLIFDIMYKSISRTQEESIKRGISSLCGKIQNTKVINEDRSLRFDLNY